MPTRHTFLFPDIRDAQKNGMENIDHQDNMAEEDLTEDPSDKNEFFEEMNFGQKMVEL